MPNIISEIIKSALTHGENFSKTISEYKNNRFFGLIIADDYPLFGEAFLVGCYKNHSKSDQVKEPEEDQEKRIKLFFDLIKEHGNKDTETISYRGKGKEEVFKFTMCEIDENTQKIRIYKEIKAVREKKQAKWIKNGSKLSSQPSFSYKVIEINNNPNTSNVLNYYLTKEVVKKLNDEKYELLGLIERSRTEIYDFLELPQPGTTGAKDDTIFIKSSKIDSFQLWKKHGYWKNQESGKLELGLLNKRNDLYDLPNLTNDDSNDTLTLPINFENVDNQKFEELDIEIIKNRKKSVSLAKLFNCDFKEIPNTPINSEFGQIVFSANIERPIFNKKIIILNGLKAFEKIDFLSQSHASGIVIIISMNEIFKFGLEKFREKFRNYISEYPHRYHSSSQSFPTSSFKSRSTCWSKTPQSLTQENNESQESNRFDLTVNSLIPNIEKSFDLLRLRQFIKNLLPKDQKQGRDDKKFVWEIYNRLFRGGSYDIGNLDCYSQFQNELGELFDEWNKAWVSKKAHPYNELIKNLPDPEVNKPYGMLTKYHGSPVKGCDDIAITVFKQIKSQDLVLISSQKELESHQGDLLLFGKAPEDFLEKLLKIGYSGSVYQVALHKDCNLKNQVDNLNNFACLDNNDENLNWRLPINIKSNTMEEKSTVNPSVNITEGRISTLFPLSDNCDYEENLEEFDIADYFEKSDSNYSYEDNESENEITSVNDEHYKASSKQITFFSENGPFLLIFGTPKVGDIAIFPEDEKALRRSIMNLNQKFNKEFWPNNDLWKRALQNWINRSKMTGVLEIIRLKFNKSNIIYYKNIDRTGPGAPDNKSDFEYLIGNIKAYGIYGFSGADRMRNFDAGSHWDKMQQKINIHRCIGRDFYKIIHEELSREIKNRPSFFDIKVNLFNEISHMFSIVKIEQLTLTEDKE
jgi:hypothetical protein